MSSSTNRSRRRKKTLRLFQRVIRDCLKPNEELLVSEWAERYRVLDSGSNLAGKWSNEVTPYLTGIMDTLNDAYIREIYLCKGTQLGGTEALINMVMYITHQSPAPTMIVYPSDDLAKDISSERLKPAFQLTPEVWQRFQERKSKELKLKFSSMTLYLTGAGSPSKLASKPIKYLFFDEIDKLGGASKKEASPYNLAKERTRTYRAQRKIFACSTPTLKTNYIWKLHESADEVRHYMVPCPYCGEFIELAFDQIKFCEDPDKKLSPQERAATAEYVCQECGCIIEDRQKPEMLRKGKWVAVRKKGKSQPKSVGFWISALYSVFTTWEDAAEEFLKSKDDPEELQNFVNSWLAEPWEDTKLKTNADTVMERQTDLPEFTVPPWARFLTGGVDVQENCLYWVVRAWGPNITSQLVARGQALDFSEVERVMNTPYLTQDGQPMVVSLTLIDSGYNADDTYEFCVNNQDWALPVKGASNPTNTHYKLSKVNRTDSRAYGITLVIVDGGKYKDMINSRMRRENGTGAWMVFNGVDRTYAEMVTAEHKVNVKSGSRTVQKWVPKREHIDNHYLDAEVYAMAAADIRGVRTLYLEQQEEDRRREIVDASRRRAQTTETFTPEENWIREHDELWIREEGE